MVLFICIAGDPTSSIETVPGKNRCKKSINGILLSVFDFGGMSVNAKPTVSNAKKLDSGARLVINMVADYDGFQLTWKLSFKIRSKRFFYSCSQF